ncbi:4-hydroxy-tetrahydrodipicolinate reductase [Microterricola viridarii]|uniref:4-hydroxy-tetrahydrodipicolinate reductase n=1 Tax=Microterricola viridarii TaxID=412690 RepID=A0A1H1X2J7_9MICO|nr:4-hydroxy-tetrahydrodipicolinate reductase [Microterricola viridarii]SDT03574.1 dihydrodipicolinate reductase [Microterricola viridarii]
MTSRIAIIGATGKMGQLAARLVRETEGFELVAELDSSSALEEMLGSGEARTDIAIDFTHPGVSQQVVDFALAHGLSVLVGTSGWSSDAVAALSRTVETLGNGAAVLVVPNFSVGSVLGTALSAIASRFFESIEIIEAHHAAKIDSPSGTAVRTAERIAEARGALGPVLAPHTDQRARGQQVDGIPIHSLRMSGLLARQEVILGGVGETLTVRHDTLSPSSYEQGIVLALRALPGLTGVTVGLDSLLGLGMPEATSPIAPAGSAADGAAAASGPAL